MKVQINTDSHVQHDESLTRHVESSVAGSLDRFGDQITRIEVHVRDKNGGKSGGNDKVCLMEARLEGRPPMTASEDADTVASAVSGAARKLQRVLDHALGKLAHAH
ncbi:HPF/RaiA family ribosome-associated protein [Marilutibacter alkalisoli]|uniref:HPF/RaiA family ribosome-associated protein n=1 Tax=Marilutibacter alkalisoli TaxID=2591633 RepID=A0A514BS87_9GAMM|nr:HPF/RaiA family ribosome-associated protein [Lysobacter alkalisoli]QDH70262.1 HPF/RaiA family ribosome-associated protein [Lysobacter alkalisoli]